MISLLSKNLLDLTKDTPQLRKFLEEQTLRYLRYEPKYICGLNKEDFIKNNYKNCDLSLIEIELLYGMYRETLDKLMDRCYEKETS